MDTEFTGKIRFEFTALVWQHSSSGHWHFVSLPEDSSAEIRTSLQWQEEGWGRLKARARLGKTDWDTAIWFDTRHNTYLLPIKSAVRKTEKIVPGKEVCVTIWV
ncbi:MAG: DUF1905 domain-containing protein [Saprospiraceae bacterium]|jgi:hypothetical protein|nr:DUF1905 domain-containing protein [Saprospiraceae bacterium]